MRYRFRSGMSARSASSGTDAASWLVVAAMVFLACLVNIDLTSGQAPATQPAAAAAPADPAPNAASPDTPAADTTPDTHPVAPTFNAPAGAWRVKQWAAHWVDIARDGRQVPVLVHYPVEAPGPLPIVVFSHGLGGSRAGYAFLGQHWASHGFVSVHIQHAGSDDAVWRDKRPAERLVAMKLAASDPRVAMSRIADVRFALDQLTRMQEDVEFPVAGRLDLNQIALAGHSFGGWTTMIVGGQRLGGGLLGQVDLADPRIKALIPMSAPPPPSDDACRNMRLPALHMTGTLDDSPITDTKAADRIKGFAQTPGPAEGGAEQYLVNFVGGDHMIFSGTRLRRTPAHVDVTLDPMFHGMIKKITTQFLEATLRQNDSARQWLQQGGMARELGDHALIRMKIKAPSPAPPAPPAER